MLCNSSRDEIFLTTMINLAKPNIYVILDIPLLEKLGRNPREVMLRAVEGGARIFQIRHKDADDLPVYQLAVELVHLAEQLDALLIINDRLDVALAAGAHGVHLGETDLPIFAARKLAGGNFIIGASARTVARAKQAQYEGADYIGYGAMFATSTKTDARPGSVETLKAIMASVEIPVYAIGGINAENVRVIKSAGCNRVCIGSGIIAADDIENTTRQIWRMLDDYK